MDNQNPPTPNPTPPIENIPVQNPIVAETPSPQAYTAPHIENPPPPKKPFMFSKVLLPFLIIIILLLGVSGTYLALNSKSKQASKVTPTPLPIEASAKAGTPADETANWKTYEDSTFQFRIKYPSDWTLATGRNEPPRKTVAFKAPNGIGLTLSLEENPNFADNDTYINFVKENYTQDKNLVKEIKVDGWKAGLLSEQEKGYGTEPPSSPFPDLPYDSVAFFARDKKTYNIDLTSPPELSIQEDLLIKILSTFKFLDPSEEVACTQDVKLCPDGSAVGRTGPNCEFAPCP